MTLPLERRVSGEDGMVLVAVLLLLSLVTALCTAMTLAAGTETLIARNHQSAAEARAAAEGGLNHALQITIASLNDWQANGFANRSAAMTAMLRGPDNLAGLTTTNADNGSLESLQIPRPPARVTLGTGSYEARLFDEDDSARGVVLSAADRTRIGEDGQAYIDTNTTIVVRAIGYGTGRTVAIIEAAISRLVLPAIVTNQNLLINGSPSIEGIKGSVHSNGNLTLTGSPDIAQDATSAGTYDTTGNPTIGGASGGGIGIVTVPPVRASDYRSGSDFILQADGKIIDNRSTGKKGSMLCNAKANPNSCKTGGFAWTFEFATVTWSLGDTTVPPIATYYVEGDAVINGSPGTSTTPAQLSIVATGDIDISGSPYLRPEDADVLFVTDMDLRITGNLTVTSEGQMLVREQVSIVGSPTLAGQLLVEGAASISPLVTANVISGNATLTYNGLTGAAGLAVSSWRQIR